MCDSTDFLLSPWCKGVDEPCGQGREGNCCYGLQSFWKHSVPNGVRSFLLLCLCLLHRHAYPHKHWTKGAPLWDGSMCVLSLSRFFGCTQNPSGWVNQNASSFPVFPSFWNACSEHQSQNLSFSITIFNLSGTKRGCVIWWVYRHGLNLSPAANYISHIKIKPPQYCLLYTSVSWLWWTVIVNWCK